MNNPLDIIRDKTRGTKYEDRLFMVGGYVRDKVMGIPHIQADYDFVLEGDALQLAGYLFEQGISEIAPVVYPRFGTAMLMVAGHNVELVTARVESYAANSRKPDEVKPGTIMQDSLRRDFTMNTLLENLHSGRIIDPTGKAMEDIADKLIRTPVDPETTFIDDPLRMMRAIRFAARFDFTIELKTWESIRNSSHRLSIVSIERIQDEFNKILKSGKPACGLTLLKDSGLLNIFVPELLEMVGVSQNKFHSYPVWEHTMTALSNLNKEASLILRLAVLFHDIGKPRTRTVDEDGRVHFYEHQYVGEKMTREIMRRMKYSNYDIDQVSALVAAHMRIGEYNPAWSDTAVRRLIRDLAGQLDDLFIIHKVDVSALNPDYQDMERADNLRERIKAIQEQQDITKLDSPLTGNEIMKILSISPGPMVKEVKEFLINEVVDGRLAADDKKTAEELILHRYSNV